VICDVARPPDINPAEAALRPDVLVIESGEVLIPGDIDFGYDIGLPPKTSYACLAETALLAMDGRFRGLHAGPQHHDGPGQGDLQAVAQARLPAGRAALVWQDYVTEEDLAAKKRALADQLPQLIPVLFARVRAEAVRKLAGHSGDTPRAFQGRRRGFDKRWLTVGVIVASTTALLARLLTWRPKAK
jgi:hypothetical protein